jgi:hypothetical protein
MRNWAEVLDAHWLGDGIVDEIWETDYQEESIPDPGGYRLYHVSMKRIWKWLRRNHGVRPTIQPKAEAAERARDILKRYGVPEKFITLQPLFDASYNTYRNAPPSWWSAVCAELVRIAPLVIVGAYWNAKAMDVPRGAYPVWNERLSAMDTLAIVNRATVHVGGESGVTIWAPIFKRPTVAVYKAWTAWERKYEDVRPITFGAPVVPAQLGGVPNHVAFQIAALWRQQ